MAGNLQNGGMAPLIGTDCENLAKYYKKHRSIYAKLIECFLGFGVNGKITEDDRQTISQGIEIAQSIDYSNFENIINEMEEEYLEDFELDGETFQIPEIVFFFKVWFPCWLLYKDYPPRLLNKARHGDFDVLLNLIRLDNNVLYDKKIAKLWCGWEKNRNSYEYLEITKSLKGLSKVDINKSKTKIRIAAFIREISENIGLELSYKEILNVRSR